MITDSTNLTNITKLINENSRLKRENRLFKEALNNALKESFELKSKLREYPVYTFLV